MSVERDPSDIHPDHDRPTPANRSDWTQDQLEAFQEAKREELRADAEGNMRDLSREHADALADLESAVDTDAVPTESVPLGDTTVDVRTKLNGELEDRLDRISKLEEGGPAGAIGEARDLLIETCMMLIVDHDEDGSFQPDDRIVWEALYRKHGLEGLSEVFEELVEPALERRERLGNLRGDGRGKRS